MGIFLITNPLHLLEYFLFSRILFLIQYYFPLYNIISPYTILFFSTFNLVFSIFNLVFLYSLYNINIKYKVRQSAVTIYIHINVLA